MPRATAIARALERKVDLGYEGATPGGAGLMLRGNPTLLKEMVRNGELVVLREETVDEDLDRRVVYVLESASRPHLRRRGDRGRCGGDEMACSRAAGDARRFGTRPR